jgi:hypothetical protein
MKTFTEWTVLEHKPIEKVSENLWRVTGLLGSIQRQMAMARMNDGRVVINNAIALDDASMKDLEAWGEPAVLLVPNAFHKQDALIWKKRYPKMTVVAPPKGQKKIAKLVAVDKLTHEAPTDDRVRVSSMDGNPSDTLLEVKSDDGTTIVFCDQILNLEKKGGAIGFALSPTGRVSVPRVTRWLGIKDRKAFTQHVERLAGTPDLKRLMFGHGSGVRENAAAELRGVVDQMK